MRRRLIITSVVLGIVVFVAISVMLARAFNAESAERAAVTDLVKAEARGDIAGAAGRLQKCASTTGCHARIASNVATIHHAGGVQVLQLEPSTSFSLGSTLGSARVAFRVGGSLPIVQCIRVRRAGNVVSGLRIELLAVSAPLKGDATCGSSGP
jgi:hypothetical protein